MSDPVEDALTCAQTDSTWLPRPVQLMRHLRALAAEVIRLRTQADIWKRTAEELSVNLEDELANKADSGSNS